MGGKGGGDTETRVQIPPELSPLYEGTAQNVLALQQRAPLSAFVSPLGGTIGSPQSGGQGQGGGRSTPFPNVPGLVLPNQPQAGVGGGLPAGSRVDGFRLGDDGIWYDNEGIGQGNNWIPPSLRGQPGLPQHSVGGAQRTSSTRTGQPVPAGQPFATSPVTGGGTRTGQPVPAVQAGLPAPFQVADPSALQNQAFGLTRSYLNQPYGTPRVTGEGLVDRPAVQAAQDIFNLGVLPRVQNDAALSGLARSTGLDQAVAAAQAQYLLPVLQEELAREERGIERDLGQQQQQIQTGLQVGGVQRGIGQERFDAQTQEFLRQQALAEQALFQPFGAFVPSTLGSQASSSGKKGGK